MGGAGGGGGLWGGGVWGAVRVEGLTGGGGGGDPLFELDMISTWSKREEP